MPRPMTAWTVIGTLFAGALCAGACARGQDRSRPIAEGPVVDVATLATAPSGPAFGVRWQLEGRSGRPNLKCKDVDAQQVVVRLRDADEPTRPAHSFRALCEASQALLPIPARPYLFTAQLLAADGRVLSTTPEQKVTVTDSGSAVQLVFEAADGTTFRAAK